LWTAHLSFASRLREGRLTPRTADGVGGDGNRHSCPKGDLSCGRCADAGGTPAVCPELRLDRAVCSLQCGDFRLLAWCGDLLRSQEAEGTTGPRPWGVIAATMSSTHALSVLIVSSSARSLFSLMLQDRMTCRSSSSPSRSELISRRIPL